MTGAVAALAGMGGGIGFLDAATTPPALTLSEGNRRASITGTGPATSRSIVQRAGGKFYLEGLGINIGIAEFGLLVPGKSLTEELFGTGVVALNQNGALFINGSSTASVGDLNNNTGCMAVDLNTRRVWVRRNAEAWAGGGDPTAGTGGSDMAAVGGSLYGGVQPRSPANAAWRIALLRPHFAFPVPAGFAPWGG